MNKWRSNMLKKIYLIVGIGLVASTFYQTEVMAFMSSDPVLDEMNRCMLNKSTVFRKGKYIYCCRKFIGYKKCVRCVEGTNNCKIVKRRPKMSISQTPSTITPNRNNMTFKRIR